jgi:hypothetical protein
MMGAAMPFVVLSVEGPIDDPAKVVEAFTDGAEYAPLGVDSYVGVQLDDDPQHAATRARQARYRRRKRDARDAVPRDARDARDAGLRDARDAGESLEMSDLVGTDQSADRPLGRSAADCVPSRDARDASRRDATTRDARDATTRDARDADDGAPLQERYTREEYFERVEAAKVALRARKTGERET